MKRLTLVRHAKSDPGSPGQADWDRTLNRRGETDAPEMARRLKGLKLKPDLLISSPAVRALSTAKYFARGLGVGATHFKSDERLYLADPKTILKVIRELGGTVDHLMIVGHNPGITECADELSAEREIDSMPTCAVVTALFDLESWQEIDWESGTEVELDYPKRIS